MRPFDLHDAQHGELLITRDGREAKFVAYAPEAKQNYQVITLIDGLPVCYSADGTFVRPAHQHLDLFMAPKKRTVWVNLYNPDLASSVWDTQERADHEGHNTRIGNKAWPLEIDE